VSHSLVSIFSKSISVEISLLLYEELTEWLKLEENQINKRSSAPLFKNLKILIEIKPNILHHFIIEVKLYTGNIIGIKIKIIIILTIIKLINKQIIKNIVSLSNLNK
jgi:hypothetical protein